MVCTSSFVINYFLIIRKFLKKLHKRKNFTIFELVFAAKNATELKFQIQICYFRFPLHHCLYQQNQISIFHS